MLNASGEFAPWLGVFETLRVIDGVPLFVAEHRKELARAMEALGMTTEADFDGARAGIPALSGRWRWVVTPEETRTFFTEEKAIRALPLSLSISPVRVGSVNWSSRFKTLSYLSHVQALKMASTPEVILLNERGDVASAGRGNIFWRRGDRIFTPAHEAGCRSGVTRGFVLAHEKVEQGHYPAKDLEEADEIFITNSMRGIVSVNEVQGRRLKACPFADKLRAAYGDAAAAQLKA
jgi:4-amino-4-deoxychorismate lyase